MRAPGSTDAVRKWAVVGCDVDTAFRIWTDRINAWWPKGHSRSGNPGTTVFLESQVGGRVHERTPEGVEYDWCEVTVWDPPRHFAYHWFLGSGPEQPTLVEVYFHPQGEGTRVEVRHRGPELIGALWSRNSVIYDSAWKTLLAAYAAACNTGKNT